MRTAFARPLRELRRLMPRRPYSIGLQMGLEAMHLVQLRADARGPAFLAAASVSYGCALDEMLASPLRLRALVRQSFADQPFRGRRVVACMPSHYVKTFVVSYTLAAGETDAGAIVKELRGRLEGDIDDWVFDFVPVRQAGLDSPRREALVAVAANTRVAGYLDLLARAGLDVIAVDIGPTALTRVIARLSSATAGNFQNLLLINFGSLSSFVTVFWGRRLMLDRPIAFAEQRLLERLRTIMDMPDAMARRLLLERGFVRAQGDSAWDEFGTALEEVLHPEFTALKAEVTKTLIYTASRTRGKTVDKIYLVGSVARYPGIAELLTESLSMPAEVLDPFSIFRHPSMPERKPALHAHPSAAVATGLALRGVPESWPNSI